MNTDTLEYTRIALSRGCARCLALPGRPCVKLGRATALHAARFDRQARATRAADRVRAFLAARTMAAPQDDAAAGERVDYQSTETTAQETPCPTPML